jgi:adenylate cyclase
VILNDSPASGLVQMSETGLHHKLCAILAADAVGYSRLMAGDERATVAALDAARAVFRTQIEAHHGRIVDMAGDSVLAVFDTAAGAAEAALAVQVELGNLQGVPEERRLRFRIGLHLGDVIEKPDGSVYGGGVNVAARLQALAEPGGVTASDAIRGAVKGRVLAGFTDLGEQQVKNIAEPLRAYKVVPNDPTAIAHAVVRMDAPVPGFGGRPAVAVLPFDNLSGEPDQEYFADGLAEDILTRLAMWRWLPVIARNSSFTFKGRNADVKEVGRALGARYILEGSVRRAGERLRVTGQLIDASAGHHLWAEKYDRRIDDLFELQDEITDSLCGALEVVIGRSEMERARIKPPTSLDAWEACQRGWWHLERFTREDFDEAERYLRRAHELDRTMSQPLACLAQVSLWRGVFRWSAPKAAFAESAGLARAALALDPGDAYAMATLSADSARARRLDEAHALAVRATTLNPSSAPASYAFALICLWRGESEEAIRAVERSIRLSANDPLQHMHLSALSACLYSTRQYERAAEVAQLSAQRGPHYPMVWRGLANALGQLGRVDEAKQALTRFLELVPGYTSEEAARETAGFRDEALFQHYLEGLRKAGWTG